jgi:hypothetical protein
MILVTNTTLIKQVQLALTASYSCKESDVTMLKIAIGRTSEGSALLSAGSKSSYLPYKLFQRRYVDSAKD